MKINETMNEGFIIILCCMTRYLIILVSMVSWNCKHDLFFCLVILVRSTLCGLGIA